jgi:hypothetical protein
MNEVQWAKRGWVCVGVEVVRCTTCARELCVDLLIDDDEKKGGEDGADWTERAREELADKYAALVVSGHSEDCLWRGRGCDGRLPNALYISVTYISPLQLQYTAFLSSILRRLWRPSDFVMSLL